MATKFIHYGGQITYAKYIYIKKYFMVLTNAPRVHLDDV